MKKTRVLLLITLGLMVLAQGCTAKKAKTTGFLSDYSHLRPESDVSARYLAVRTPLFKYTSFIVDPVQVVLHTGSKAKLTAVEQAELTAYMHEAIVRNLRVGNYAVVQKPGPGVARVRVALTDIKKSKIAQNILPQTKLIGTGLGGASMEAEVLDSQTKVQLAAIVQSQLGNRLSLDGLSTWGDAKAVMEDWAVQFRERLDQIHGR
jgi:hypothetical protein